MNFKELNTPETVWIFDYDLTLYGFNEAKVLYGMDEYINEFVMNHLNVTQVQANKIRNEYWQKYGTTLAGLRAQGAVDPHAYFDFIHNGANIVMPQENKTLQTLLQTISGTKVVFTNGRKDWASRGLSHIGIENEFDHLFDLEDSNWIGKPHKNAYEPVIQKLNLNSNKNILFFDDKIDNLKTASELGWKTVWMNPELENKKPNWLDYQLGHINDLKLF